MHPNTNRFTPLVCHVYITNLERKNVFIYCKAEEFVEARIIEGLWENQSGWLEGEAERMLNYAVKLMYDRTDWCFLSDISEVNVVRRRQ